MKTKLFKTAWAIRARFASFAEALTHAWKVIKLQAKLKAGHASFTFKKVDGSIRKAVGTLSEIPMSLQPKGVKPANHAVLNFFDVELQEWRSAKVENLIW